MKGLIFNFLSYLDEADFVVKTSIGENRVFVSIKAIGDFEAEFMEPF
jgi:hypothetical protein